MTSAEFLKSEREERGERERQREGEKRREGERERACAELLYRTALSPSLPPLPRGNVAVGIWREDLWVVINSGCIVFLD